MTTKEKVETISATESQKRSIIKSAQRMGEVVARTIVESAKDVIKEFWQVYGGDADPKDIEAIAKEIGGKVPARVSEWRVFFRAIPYGLDSALKAYPKGAMTRVVLFKLAREVLANKNYHTASKVAISLYKTRGKSSKGRPATIGMGLGIIKNAQTRKPNEIKFRKALIELCKEHGIKW